jgi:DNA-directed RNA polymerase II subunit RPB1
MGAKMDDCPGHFGHVELCRPVYHCGFIDEVTRILRCVCFHCSRLLLDDKVPKDRDVMKIHDCETRFRKIHDRCNRANIRCETVDPEDITMFLDGLNIENGAGSVGGPSLNGESQADAVDLMNLVGAMSDESKGEGSASSSNKRPPCGATMPRFSKNGMVITVIYPDDMETIPGNGQRRQELSASKVYDIFRQISDEDVVKLGFDPKWARPEWMLVSVLPVPPPHVRPTVVDGDIQSEDDLTYQLTNIIKANLSLEAAIIKGEARHIVADYEKLLQQRVISFFDNERDDNPRETQKTGRPLKTIRQRLKGKEGRLRGNLMGKRVDFSARTVITADPNLSIDQVGVPKSVALILTVPVTVTPFNINHLTNLVANGPQEWPGANYIIRSDGTRKDLRYGSSKNDFVLEYGWVVERHLCDDDIVLFNRQPSLHKMSIMGHRAKILDWSTFRLNLSVTTPYNADFDGDEMNLHVPQSITARADAQELMMVPRNIITPQVIFYLTTMSISYRHTDSLCFTN